MVCHRGTPPRWTLAERPCKRGWEATHHGGTTISFPFKPRLSSVTFDALVSRLRQTFAQFPDQRTGKNIRYTLEDAALGAFAVFFTQSPSFLAFQRSMQIAKGQSNARTLFAMHQIPCDNQIRNLLDGVAPAHALPMFARVVDTLHELGYLEPFRSLNGDLLVPLDGTQYHASKDIHCAQCTQTHHRDGQTTYSHTVITPVIAAPGQRAVIALEPEFITPQDGHDKQDCENAAAKRWLAQHGTRYRALGVTVLGDDLYSRQSLCEAIVEQGLNFVLVCKPTSHKTLYEWVAGLETTGGVHTLTQTRRRGKKTETDTYRFVSQVPLRDGDDALQVNWCELTTTRADGRVIYNNAFATNHPVTADNVADIVKAGRTRWKVENENNNTLKTKGYHLTHNFGHGKQHLSTLLATLNLLAFLFHTVLGMSDAKYQLIRQHLPTRKTFFNDIRALTRYLYFESWHSLLEFMLRGLELEAPDTS